MFWGPVKFRRYLPPHELMTTVTLTEEPGLNVPPLGEKVACPVLELVQVALAFDRADSVSRSEQCHARPEYGQVAASVETSPGAPTVPGDTVRCVRRTWGDPEAGTPSIRKVASIVRPTETPATRGRAILASGMVLHQQMAAP